MIEIKNLTKKYEGGEALCGIDFAVKTGEICAVAGKDGSGKTTLCDLLSGAIEPDKGQILVCGTDMIEHPSAAKQHLGYVPAESALYQDMTPRAGMKFIADARGIGGREATDLIDAAIRRFGLKDVADSKVKGLSSGVRKLVSMAQAAFTGAEILIIDEPTKGLDPKEIIEVRELLNKLRKDHAILLASQSLTELCAVADRVLMMKDGKVVAEGKPDQLHRLTMNDGTLHLTVRADEAAVRAALNGIKNAEITEAAEHQGECSVVLAAKDGADIREAAFKAICEKGLVLLNMTQGVKPLDDLLKELTSERLAYALEKEEQADEGNL